MKISLLLLSLILSLGSTTSVFAEESEADPVQGTLPQR